MYFQLLETHLSANYIFRDKSDYLPIPITRSGVRRRKVKKILYDKYVPMLTIRNDHINNHFSDKFIPLYHISYFINDDG